MATTQVHNKRRQKIVADACREKLPSLTIAKRLHAQHPKLFASVEVARSAVRRLRGNNGGAHRKEVVNKIAFRPSGSQSDRPPLPKSLAKKREPYILEARRVLILSDTHVPFHDRDAIEAALRFGEAFGPDAILWNGDVLDYEALSTYDRPPDGPKPDQELLAARQLFAAVHHRFTGVKQVFKLGNHEARWNRYFWNRAPELYGLLKDTWQDHCGIGEFGIDVVDDKRVVMSGLLPIFHGHEVLKSSVQPAKALITKLGTSGHCSHFHRTSTFVKKPFGKTPIKGSSQACLCHQSPDFMPVNEWSLGFATNEVAKDGTYNLKLYEIIDGKVTSA